MDLTTFSQTMDIDVDFDGNQSYQPTNYNNKLLSIYAKDNHTFNFEDTEVTFEFTKYIQQLCTEMEDAKNRIDGGDNETVKNILNCLIDKVQADMSMVNTSMNKSLASVLNQTTNNVTINNTTINNATINNTTINNKSIAANNTTINSSKSFLNNTSKNETSILGLLSDLFRENKSGVETSPIEKITKLNILSRSIKEANLSINNSNMNDRSILKSIKEEDKNTENKENDKSNDTLQESILIEPEVTFINKSVCSPLMELISAVEKKLDFERLEENLKADYELKLNEKDVQINKQNDEINKLKQEINQLNEKCKDRDCILEQLERQKKENEVLDEIISDEKRKLDLKQGTIIELNNKIVENMNKMKLVENDNIELRKEVNRLNIFEKENKSLNEQIKDLMKRLERIYELERLNTNLKIEINEKNITIDNVRYELKTSSDHNQRLTKDRTDLMNKLDKLIKEDETKSTIIDELKQDTTKLNAQLSLQNDKNDFLNAKLKDIRTLKNQLETDRKDICWQINKLLENTDCDFDDLKTFLVGVEQKISSTDCKKPKGAAFVKSLASNTIKEAGKI